MPTSRQRAFGALVIIGASVLGACSSSSSSTPAPAATADVATTTSAPATSGVETTAAADGAPASTAIGATSDTTAPSDGAAPDTTASAPAPANPSASAGDPTQAAYTPTGTLIADDGFRPNVNGFGFENYGALPDGGSNMTPADVQKIFGNGVCAEPSGNPCTLIPQAQSWMDQTNQAMGGGHCFGFAVATSLLWQSTQLKPADFGATATPALPLAGNTSLQRQIAVNWAYQVLDSVRAAVVTGTPNEIVDKLKASLVPNPTELYTIAIFSDHGGHAVTPYAIEDQGGGKLAILVYDNNWPGVVRAIQVDTNANTWQYVAALNPREPSQVYQGDATTKNLLLYPTTPALATQPCPFCGKVPAGTASSGLRRAGKVAGSTDPVDTDEIYLEGSDVDHGHLLITDPSGRRLGYVDGRLVNEIPGGKVVLPMSDQSWLVSPEPNYEVPEGVAYTITLDGSALTGSDEENVGIIGSSYELAVDGIHLDPGDVDTMVVAPYATELSFTSNHPETPELELGVSDESADYLFTLKGASDQAGSTIKVGLPQEGGVLDIDAGSSTGTSTFALTMDREGDDGTLHFSHAGLALDAGDRAQLQFGAWSADGDGIPLVTTHAGTSSTIVLTDE
jgi:hypothetical protein